MATQVVTDSLIHRWECEDWSSGTTWTDRVGSKAITFSSAPSSKTADGIELTSSITFTSAQLTSVTYPATFEWIGRIDGAWTNSSPGNVFGWSSSNGYWGGICCYSKISSNGLQLDIGSSGTVTSGVYGAGTYHVVVTVTSSTTTLYINSTTASGTTTSSTARGTKRYLYNSEGFGRFSGAVYAMRIWSKCLSSDEIATLFTEEAADTPIGYVQLSGKPVPFYRMLQKRSGVWTELTSDDFSAMGDTYPGAYPAWGGEA